MPKLRNSLISPLFPRSSFLSQSLSQLFNSNGFRNARNLYSVFLSQKIMDKLSKSAMKSPAATATRTNSKRVTFKVAQTAFPSIGHSSEKLESAMRDANEVVRLEADNQQLLKDIKGLFAQYHAQCLTRYQVEKMLNEKSIKNNTSLAQAEAKRREYLDLIGKCTAADSSILEALQ